MEKQDNVDFYWRCSHCFSWFKILKSDTAHDLAVKGLAGDMKFKSDTTCKYETIKEDAKDLLEEAKVKNEG